MRGVESSRKAQQTLELWAASQDNSDGPSPSHPHAPDRGPKRRHTALLITALVLVTVAASAGATYGAIDNNWAPDIFGTFYSEDEHQVDVARSSESAHEIGYAEGWDAGERNGFAEGQEAGYREGRTDGYDDGYTVGYSSGGQEAYDNGYYDGYGEGWTEGCMALFDALGTDRVGDWWDYYYSPTYASYYNTNACG